MDLDIADLMAFYEAPLGRIARHLVGARLRALWPSVAGERVMGLGYASPYLRPLLGEADRVSAMMPGPLGVVGWPTEGPVRTALVLEDSLPLTDSSVDRVLVVHGLEHVDSPQRVLREIWRVLTPGGRAVIVVPNRTGLWTRAETTPFGSGRSYSRRQIDQLLSASLFTPIAWEAALFVPPWPRRFLMSSAHAWERAGSRLWPAVAGVVLVEAEKRLYQGLVAKEKGVRGRLLVPAAAVQRGSARGGPLSAAAGTPPAGRTGSRTPTAS